MHLFGNALADFDRYELKQILGLGEFASNVSERAHDDPEITYNRASSQESVLPVTNLGP